MITNTELEYKGNLYPNHIVEFAQDTDKIYFTTDNGVVLQITILRGSIIRFRYATNYNFEPDFSYAIDPEATMGYSKLEVVENDTEYIISTARLNILVDKKTLRTQISDLNGTIINEDELGFHWEENYEYGGNTVKLSKITQSGESFYGMGDKAMHSNLKGKRVENWVTDQFAYAKEQDPLYKAIPFYIGLNKGIAYGIYFDNSFRTGFDFSQERRNITSFWAEGGEMNYYFIFGPDMPKVVSSYSSLTGTPELPPMWALGFHQSKWSYYPESNVKEIASEFRKLQIPCDAIYLDIDYMDGFRCFTWDKNHFPDPKRMIQELEEDGFKTVVMIDPGIKVDRDYWIYNEALENGYFCKRGDGPLMHGKVWPGECNFPDFTNPAVREWWAELYKEFMSDLGVHAVWNDMNEPAVMEVPSKTAPLDTRHDYDGNPCTHRKAHNVYGMQMVRATYEGVKKYVYPKRPFVITRAAFSGTQRYSSTWTGDNVATWEHLWIANVQVQRMCLSGYSFVGSDIGGFAEQPDGELFARWVQLGIFHPFCRVHSSGDHGDQEPWSFGSEITDIVRKFVELRYQLLPYLYTMFYKYTKENVPMVQSLVFFDQEDNQTHFRTDEFIFGDKILVCPIQEPNAQGRRMYVPRGEWYDFWTNEFVEGGKEKWVAAALDMIPIFVKAGSIIPKYPIQQYVGEKKIEELVLDVYYKEGTETSEVYEDANNGYDYKKGRYSLSNYKLTGKDNSLIIQLFKDGTFDTEYEKMKLNFHGLPFEISSVKIDNEEIPLKSISINDNNDLLIDKNFTLLHLSGKE
ncbi:MAG: glycoside hydrolase family 31 protein [Maribacter dokdonensis]|uniref:Alpha-glucosidase n=2 Tax=Maribacter dokdonensis TaxID=320912 RepID=A0ABY0U3T5_9FLAO|nr:glycoside hydrolase family 31 protein [Maribacter dokdonensis]KSA11970.1 Alpha-glucosidase, family 31 of glycosyl hydrolase [Maribacter dokdonensis DSW-8]MBU2902852.1 glycoside hydrolase family 31 protein [Maribacter dokdonensis]MDP2525199.1 glycoside hydrolase family 31 protein [Maribacter dokdonensis]SDS01943.1 alpha-glucosidase [Maribacter dokdonensis]